MTSNAAAMAAAFVPSAFVSPTPLGLNRVPILRDAARVVRRRPYRPLPLAAFSNRPKTEHGAAVTTTTTTTTTNAAPSRTQAVSPRDADETSHPRGHGVQSPDEAAEASEQASPPLSVPLSVALLNLTTVLWGTQHAVIKLALSDADPSTLNLLRFFLAALLSLPALPALPSPRKLLQTPAFRYGLELSVYLFAGYALQSLALLTTSASRSAFLLYLNVKFVPLLARVVYKRRVPPIAWASAALALLGTALLTYDGAPPVPGDLFSVAAAAASALFILRTEAAARAPVSAPALNATTLVSVACLMGLWAGGDLAVRLASATFGAAAGPPQIGMVAQQASELLTHAFPQHASSWVAVAYLALVPTALCNVLQAVGQRAVSAERAAVVFALDPVYAAVFAWLLLGERLGAQGVAGAGVIVAAAALSGVAERFGGAKKQSGENADASSKGHSAAVADAEREVV